MDKRNLKERLADSEWVKNWFDQAGPEAIKEIERLEERLFEAERNIIDLHDQLAQALDYFEDKMDADFDDQEFVPNEEMQLYQAGEPVWCYADAYVKKYQLNYKDYINNTLQLRFNLQVCVRKDE